MRSRFVAFACQSAILVQCYMSSNIFPMSLRVSHPHQLTARIFISWIFNFQHFSMLKNSFTLFLSSLFNLELNLIMLHQLSNFSLDNEWWVRREEVDVGAESRVRWKTLLIKRLTTTTKKKSRFRSFETFSLRLPSARILLAHEKQHNNSSFVVRLVRKIFA